MIIQEYDNRHFVIRDNQILGDFKNPRDARAIVDANKGNRKPTKLEAAATLALDLIKAHWPLEHGNPQVGEAWGALEKALGLPPA